MANANVMGLLEELGLGNVNEQAMFQQALASGSNQYGGGLAGTMAAAGQQLGQNIAPAVGGLFKTAKNSLTKDPETGKRQGGFNFSQGVRDVKDATIAQQMGLSGPEELRTRRASQAAISALQFENTGDPIVDQSKALDKIIAVANQHGDAKTVNAAMKKKVQLEAQQKEFDKQDGQQKKLDRENRIQAEMDTTGRTVQLVGDEADGAVSKAIMQEDGTWKVWRPDGTVEEGVDGGKLIFVDPKNPQRDRQFETETGQLSTALKLNGLTGQAITKPRSFLADMGTQAVIVNDMTQSLLDMYNPAVAFSDSATGAVAADRAFSMVETLSSLFTRKGDTPTDVTYNDKKVSPELQYKEATSTDHYTSFLASQGLSLRNVLPAHIQVDSQQAQLFIANVMQLAYLDARLQEPANRGLSDNDVQAALKRIGAGSPDPKVFALRQKQNIGRLNNTLNNLGVEFSGTADVSKQDLINHVYTPELRSRVSSQLGAAEATIDEFLNPQTDITQELEGTTEELEAELERLLRGE